MLEGVNRATKPFIWIMLWTERVFMYVRVYQHTQVVWSLFYFQSQREQIALRRYLYTSFSVTSANIKIVMHAMEWRNSQYVAYIEKMFIDVYFRSELLGSCCFILITLDIVHCCNVCQKHNSFLCLPITANMWHVFENNLVFLNIGPTTAQPVPIKYWFYDSSTVTKP